METCGVRPAVRDDRGDRAVGVVKTESFEPAHAFGVTVLAAFTSIATGSSATMSTSQAPLLYERLEDLRHQTCRFSEQALQILADASRLWDELSESRRESFDRPSGLLHGTVAIRRRSTGGPRTFGLNVVSVRVDGRERSTNVPTGRRSIRGLDKLDQRGRRSGWNRV